MSVRLFSSFIKKTNNPCINCINYIKYKYAYPHDEIYDRKTILGTCSKFGKEHLVTGEIEYDDALECRINDSKCGKEGRYYNSTIYQKIIVQD